MKYYLLNVKIVKLVFIQLYCIKAPIGLEIGGIISIKHLKQYGSQPEGSKDYYVLNSKGKILTKLYGKRILKRKKHILLLCEGTEDLQRKYVGDCVEIENFI